MNRPKLKPSPVPAGFTRADLLATLAALVLFACVTLPLLANSRPRSERVQCVNNLRQIAAGFQAWGDGHGDVEPWEVALAEGGTFQHALAANVWFHFAWMSNELASPKILLCPSDTGRPARDFSGDPAGGYLHPNFANRATSYFLSHPRGFRPEDMLAGDRNLSGGTSGSCSRFSAAYLVNRPGIPNLAWTSALHDQSGNVLALDGRVEQFNTTQLQRSQATFDDTRAIHYISPR